MYMGFVSPHEWRNIEKCNSAVARSYTKGRVQLECLLVVVERVEIPSNDIEGVAAIGEGL